MTPEFTVFAATSIPALDPVADVLTTCFVVFAAKLPVIVLINEIIGPKVFVKYCVPFAKYKKILNPKNAKTRIIIIQVTHDILLKNEPVGTLLELNVDCP